ncbi:2-isopropylmalate synthase [Craterilacuibacter sinensis]|uniref:2-isopropylmalate synthase n=1 Tax=Craterilacuibacter sinensis TaxID=2686017 RepID=A0A845BU60_9NEIS|nr:2-isopropylmalate synthase [Craterilacuibacter sinensis]MXR36073.1 2-isopropylmalate synthase [Craterilacuibacter sinensis]RQW28358.1 2-isopropylmalate synthase [Rhodobacteraceae bacterium CH30]
MQLDIERLIADFGGPGVIAEALSLAFPDEPVSRAAIYKWRERGSLPLAQLNKLAQLAASQGRRFDYSDYLVGVRLTGGQRRAFDMGDRLIVFDTTLRDGEQSPGASMTREEKLRIARQLERLGVDVIEAGFAAASAGDAESIRSIAEAIRESTVCSLARANERDIRAAGEAIAPAARGRIHTFIATSPIHMEKKLRMQPDEVIEAAVKAVKLAREYTDDVEFSAEDALRSDPTFLAHIFGEVIAAGASTINVPDTVGYAVPRVTEAFFRDLIGATVGGQRVVWSAHCHNDLGMAVANSLAAVLGGARQVECTINGLGERAGNAALEEIVMAVKTRRDVFNLETRIDTSQIVPASRLVSTITGYPVQPNKAIVGANAFAHESGIHQDGVLKHRETYEIMSAESVGWSANRLTLGKLSGRNAFKTKLAALGIIIDSEEALNAAFTRFKELADKKREIFDEDLHALVSDELVAIEQEDYKFVSLKVATETGEPPLASIVFAQHGAEQRAESSGSGPVDAAFKAIESVVNSGAELELYSVNAITKGTESQGEVTVRLEKEGRIVNGQGADTDIIVASAKAYLSALNKLSHKDERLKAQGDV